MGGAKKAVFDDHYQVRRCHTAVGRRKALDLVVSLCLAASTKPESWDRGRKRERTTDGAQQSTEARKSMWIFV